MALTRPISTSGHARDELLYPRDSKEIEQLRLFLVSIGAYRDVSPPSYPRTKIGALTAGSKTKGGMSIRGGVL